MVLLFFCLSGSSIAFGFHGAGLVATSCLILACFVPMFGFYKNYPFLGFISNHLIYYPTPISLTYAWSFGFLAGMCLLTQMISGIFLAMHYTPHVDLAFSSVEYIMRDVPNGWFLRYVHANGASMFFIVVYLHVFKGFSLQFYTKPRELLWCSGVILLVLMVATAFIGYVLPWGEISFEESPQIHTNSFSKLPVAGKAIVEWLWGGFTLSNPTVIRFILPFLIAGGILIFLTIMYKDRYRNSLSLDTGIDVIGVYPCVMVINSVTFFCICILVFYLPEIVSFILCLGQNILDFILNYCSFIKELTVNIWSRLSNIMENVVYSILDFVANYFRPERRLMRDAAGEIMTAEAVRIARSELVEYPLDVHITTEAEHRYRIFKLLDKVSDEAPRTRVPKQIRLPKKRGRS